MAVKEGLGLRDIRPFRKARTPLYIILGNGMILRQVKGDNAWIHSTDGYLHRSCTNDVLTSKKERQPTGEHPNYKVPAISPDPAPWTSVFIIG